MTPEAPPPGIEPAGIEPRDARSLIADLHAIVWEADAHTRAFTFVSQGAVAILGYTPKEWVADANFWAEHLHPDDREHTMSRFVRASVSGSLFDAEYRVIANGGSIVWLRDIGRTVNDADGRPFLIRGLMTDITARKTLEGPHDEVEGRFQRVVERLAEIVYMEQVQADPAELGRLIYVSPRVEQILGFTPREWTEDPLTWARQFHPDDRDLLRSEYERASRTDQPLSVEYRMYSRDGRIVWFRDEAVLIRDDRGKPSYWQGVLRDITEEHEAKDRMFEVQTRYDTLLDHLPAIVYAEDAGGDRLLFIYIGPRLERVLGISQQEWLRDPRTWIAAVHPDDRSIVAAARYEADRSGEPFSAEYRMIARSDSVLWFRDEGMLVSDRQGRPAYRQGVMFDITSTKEAEARLAEAEERYREVLGHTPAITYIDALEGPSATLYISQQTTEVLGYTPHDWYDDPDLRDKIVHPDDQGPSRLISTDAPIDSVYRVRAADGRLIWVHDQAHLVTDDQGNPKYWQGTMVDITHMRRTEQLERDLARERDLAEQLRAADEMKNTFLQAVSHDLRTPLAAILGLALTLKRDDLDLDVDETRDIASRIAQNARKLDRIVTDLLDLDRLARGILAPDFLEVDLGNLVSRLVGGSDLMEGHTLDLDAEPLVVVADATMVERIVENLLANAAKHTPEGSHVWVRVERAEEGALIVVEDDGSGVPAAEREPIFDAFRQGESGAESGGAGVGLALVASFAELHEGRAWVEDRPGGGASFRVYLAGNPGADLSEAEAQPEAEPEAEPEAQPEAEPEAEEDVEDEADDQTAAAGSSEANHA